MPPFSTPVHHHYHDDHAPLLQYECDHDGDYAPCDRGRVHNLLYARDVHADDCHHVSPCVYVRGDHDRDPSLCSSEHDHMSALRACVRVHVRCHECPCPCDRAHVHSARYARVHDGDRCVPYQHAHDQQCILRHHDSERADPYYRRSTFPLRTLLSRIAASRCNYATRLAGMMKADSISLLRYLV